MEEQGYTDTQPVAGSSSYIQTGLSPLGHLAALGLLDAYDLVAVEEAERVEGGLDLDREAIRVSQPPGKKHQGLLTFLMASTVLWPSSCGR